MTREWAHFNQRKSAHIPLTVPGNLYTSCQRSGTDYKSFAPVAKALRASKTQRRDGQIIYLFIYLFIDHTQGTLNKSNNNMVNI